MGKLTIDWQYFVEVLPQYKAALWLTVKLAAIGILLAIAVGIICSMIQYFKVDETLKPAFGENISADDVVVEGKKEK